MSMCLMWVNQRVWVFENKHTWIYIVNQYDPKLIVSLHYIKIIYKSIIDAYIIVRNQQQS